MLLCAPFAEPRFHEQGQSSDLGMGLIADGNVVVGVFEHVAGNLGTTNHDQEGPVSSNSGDHLPVRFSVHGEVNDRPRFAITGI